MPLGPVLMLRPHRGGKRRGLIALDMGDVGLDFLLDLLDGLPQVRHGAARALNSASRSRGICRPA